MFHVHSHIVATIGETTIHITRIEDQTKPGSSSGKTALMNGTQYLDPDEAGKLVELLYIEAGLEPYCDEIPFADQPYSQRYVVFHHLTSFLENS